MIKKHGLDGMGKMEWGRGGVSRKIRKIDETRGETR